MWDAIFHARALFRALSNLSVLFKVDLLSGSKWSEF